MTDTERIDALLKTRAWRAPMIAYASRDEIDAALLRGNPDSTPATSWTIEMLDCREPGSDWEIMVHQKSEEAIMHAYEITCGVSPQGVKVRVVSPAGRVTREAYIA